jgi:hypothetical protein
VRRALLGTFAATASGVAAYLSEQVVGWVAGAAIGVLVFVAAAALLRIFTAAEIGLMRQGLRRVTRRLKLSGRAGAAARQIS